MADSDRRHRRSGRVATAASITCVAVGLGLVGTALAGQASPPVEPPLVSAEAAAAGADPEEAVSTPTATPSPEDTPTPESTRAPGSATKGDVMPTGALAPEGDIPGLVRIPPPPPAPEPTPEVEPAVVVADPVRLRVPAIGVDTDLLHLGLDDGGALAVPPRTGPDNLKASWYDGSPRAGEVGPTIIAGHIDSKEGPSVFYRLGELAPGDEVLVDRADGTTATFVVDTSERYPKDDFPTQRVYGSTDDAQVRLITCGGVFDRESGHYRDNTVVYGHLVEG